MARGSSIDAADWRTSAQLAGSIRIERPIGYLTADGFIEQGRGGLGLRSFSVNPVLASNAFNGFRLITAAEYQRDPFDTKLTETTVGRLSLSYHFRETGAWLGASPERNARPSYSAGMWRQLGSRLMVSVASTIRQAAQAGRPPHFWTETHFDSIYTDSSGWYVYPVERLFGDSGTASRRYAWAETEARVGWSFGRLALDGVAGWRPRVDTSHQTAWVRGYLTAAITPGLALSVGAGTTTRRQPYSLATGRFGVLGLRFAPAALVRPREVPEITPTASAFTVEPVAAGDYVVRVRLPRARVVELSGDFCNWKPIRLTQGSGNEWLVTLSLKPGTYHMNLRIDGEAWVPPPGTTAVDDEFNGQVGIVIVR